MEEGSAEICIVGAGISGLIAAKTLEQAGYAPTIVEQSESVGGRVQTDIQEGIHFDRGFQVLLTAYPQAKKHLDYQALDLQRFKPGALIFRDGKSQRIGDPLRDISALLPTLTATVATLKDKIKIFSLSQRLKRKSIAAIFLEPETTTLSYLRNYGFSSRVIENFFLPFFTGIFLEDELRTSSRMFEFVFKMFAEGDAAIPAAGIGAIPEQLARQLDQTKIQFGETVTQWNDKGLLFADGRSLEAEHIITTAPLKPDAIQWKSCANLYFEVQDRVFPTGIIGLIADKETLINNVHYLFEAQSGNKKVLSVTIVKKHDLNLEQLVNAVKAELSRHCGIVAGRLLKHYQIVQALPDIEDLTMQPPVAAVGQKGFYTAGDYLLNSSLNAAMLSGQYAAEAIQKNTGS